MLWGCVEIAKRVALTADVHPVTQLLAFWFFFRSKPPSAKKNNNNIFFHSCAWARSACYNPFRLPLSIAKQNLILPSLSLATLHWHSKRESSECWTHSVCVCECLQIQTHGHIFRVLETETEHSFMVTTTLITLLVGCLLLYIVRSGSFVFIIFAACCLFPSTLSSLQQSLMANRIKPVLVLNLSRRGYISMHCIATLEKRHQMAFYCVFDLPTCQAVDLPACPRDQALHFLTT